MKAITTTLYRQSSLKLAFLLMLMGISPGVLWGMQGQQEFMLTDVQHVTLADFHEMFYKVEYNKKINLDINDQSVEQALRKVALKTGLSLSYRGDIMTNKKVTLKNRQISASDALEYILKGTGLDYGFSRDGYLVITPKLETLHKVEAFELVQGQVTDAETGDAMPGVNISVKGTMIGTSSDAEGRYSLNVPSLSDTLVFSFIGYQTMEVPISGRTEVSIALQPQTIVGEELVVVGYGTQRKSDLTGAVTSISEDDFNAGVNVSVDQLMQGKVAGALITQTDGDPGGGFSINIRGVGSLNAGTQPLYVIDGLPIDSSPLLGGGGLDRNPRNPLNTLNPNDIESIEILKDASATAIYGSRGANGVVLITTKKGTRGDVQINYEGYAGIQNEVDRPDILSTQQYIEFINDISEKLGNGTVFTQSEINEIGLGTNWQDQIYRTNAPVASHDLALSGGDKNARYYASLNYFNQRGVVKNSGIEKYIARINLQNDFDKGQAGFNLSIGVIDNDNIIGGANKDDQVGPINASMFFDPTEPIYDDEGLFRRSPNLAIDNPVSVVEGWHSFTKDRRAYGNVFFQYNLTEEISAKLNFGYDYTGSQREEYETRATRFGRSSNGKATIADLERSNALVEYTMNYIDQFGENHSLNVLGGITYQYFTEKQLFNEISGFPTDATLTNNLSLGDDGTDELDTNRGEHKLLSYLGRVNYTLADKYLLTSTLRVDGSSRFGENNKFGVFPSFALGWRISEEDFGPPLFSNLKLRVSWGVTGNQAIGNYNFLTTYNPGRNAVIGDEVVTSVAPTRIANPDLKWETTEQLNFGLDAAVFEGRISGSFDYFIRNTKDMLINKPLPSASGFGSMLSNIGDMRNKGFEFQISSTNISKQNFTWSTTINFTTVQNEVTDLGDISEVIVGRFIGEAAAIMREGDPLASYYGYEVTGIFQTDDNIAASPQPDAQPGFPKFRDTNGDGRITPDDRTIIGNPRPDFFYGISNSVNYKRFQLDFFIQGQHGVDLINLNMLETIYPTNFRFNRLAEPILNRWTPENPNTKWPSAVQPTSYGAGRVTSMLIEDASYVRLKNVKLTYSIPTNFIRSATVYVSANNLITITDYSLSNPEGNSHGRSIFRVGQNVYPLAQTWLLGISLGI